MAKPKSITDAIIKTAQNKELTREQRVILLRCAADLLSSQQERSLTNAKE
jgi:hypothetical protein